MPEQIENRMVVDSEWENNIPDIVPKKCDCGNDIYTFEDYWDFDDRICCKECLSDYLFEHRKVVM